MQIKPIFISLFIFFSIFSYNSYSNNDLEEVCNATIAINDKIVKIVYNVADNPDSTTFLKNYSCNPSCYTSENPDALIIETHSYRDSPYSEYLDKLITPFGRFWLLICGKKEKKQLHQDFFNDPNIKKIDITDKVELMSRSRNGHTYKGGETTPPKHSKYYLLSEVDGYILSPKTDSKYTIYKDCQRSESESLALQKYWDKLENHKEKQLTSYKNKADNQFKED